MKKDLKKSKGLNIFNEEFEKALDEVIDEKIRGVALKLAEEDIEKIINALTSSLDKLISEKIRNHMTFIGQTLISNIKE
jgi:hypothetical protein